MRALVTAIVYFGTFIALGMVLRRWLHRQVDLDDRQQQTGRRRLFLLGAWRTED
ncbi:MAG TPA: hypothetical protein VMI56_04455 [Reyranella sp.]|nr:hypothetical protein [Reyranella sp.]